MPRFAFSVLVLVIFRASFLNHLLVQPDHEWPDRYRIQYGNIFHKHVKTLFMRSNLVKTFDLIVIVEFYIGRKI